MNKRLLRIMIGGTIFFSAIILFWLLDKQWGKTILWLEICIYAAAFLVSGGDVLLKAARNILRGQVFDENFLMTIATIGAFVIGEYPEAVAVMLFYQVGEYFQARAVGKSRSSIAKLMDIRPDYATVLVSETESGNIINKNNIGQGDIGEGCIEVKKDPSEVAIGDIIVIAPGERIPLDGRVLSGVSSVDTSALTGESLPREVSVGDEVISGCINTSGVLTVEVTKTFGESTVSKILSLVENASGKKSAQEKFITKFARYYTPAVVVAATLLAALPPILAGASFAKWLYIALSFLVASCPCALVISIPMSFFGGIGGASRCGILIKGGNYLEALAKTDTVVFDKTGTLTEGKLRVQKIVPFGLSGAAELSSDLCRANNTNINTDNTVENSANLADNKADNAAKNETDSSVSDMAKLRILKSAAYAESFSHHPIARSLCAAYTENIDKARVKDVTEIAGKGLLAVVDGVSVAVGNSALMASIDIDAPAVSEIGTVVHVAADGVYLGYILIADEIKPDSFVAIARLREAGIKHTVMLTGDVDAVGQVVGAKLDIDRVYTGLLPSGKVEKFEDILSGKKSGKVAFAGDGINDAPVLARADIGIAMGGLGSDAAIEAADVVIMDDKPSKIATAKRIARHTLSIAYQNIFFAITIKAVVLVLIALSLVGMWMAIIADVGVTILAVLNAFRALNVKRFAAENAHVSCAV